MSAPKKSVERDDQRHWRPVSSSIIVYSRALFIQSQLEPEKRLSKPIIGQSSARRPGPTINWPITHSLPHSLHFVFALWPHCHLLTLCCRVLSTFFSPIRQVISGSGLPLSKSPLSRPSKFFLPCYSLWSQLVLACFQLHDGIQRYADDVF